MAERYGRFRRGQLVHNARLDRYGTVVRRSARGPGVFVLYYGDPGWMTSACGNPGVELRPVGRRERTVVLARVWWRSARVLLGPVRRGRGRAA